MKMKTASSLNEWSKFCFTYSLLFLSFSLLCFRWKGWESSYSVTLAFCLIMDSVHLCCRCISNSGQQTLFIRSVINFTSFSPLLLFWILLFPPRFLVENQKERKREKKSEREIMVEEGERGESFSDLHLNCCHFNLTENFFLRSVASSFFFPVNFSFKLLSLSFHSPPKSVFIKSHYEAIIVDTFFAH